MNAYATTSASSIALAPASGARTTSNEPASFFFAAPFFVLSALIGRAVPPGTAATAPGAGAAAFAESAAGFAAALSAGSSSHATIVPASFGTRNDFTRGISSTFPSATVRMPNDAFGWSAALRFSRRARSNVSRDA